MEDVTRNTEPRFRNIYEAINAVMCDIGAVGKNNRNEQQRYQYRGIDDVMTALAPAMQKHGVFVTPEVLEQIREEKDGRNSKLLYSVVKVKYTFRALDGSSVEAVVVGEGMDSGDKATNKAMSAAFKYALLQTFCIPTSELVDSEKDSPEVVKGSPKSVKESMNLPEDRITEEEAINLFSLLKENDVNIPALCKLYKVKRIDDLTPAQMLNIYGKLGEVRKNEANRNEGQADSSDSNGAA